MRLSILLIIKYCVTQIGKYCMKKSGVTLLLKKKAFIY